MIRSKGAAGTGDVIQVRMMIDHLNVASATISRIP